MSDKLRLYPRGFLGKNVQSQTERTVNPYQDQINQHQFMVDTNQNSSVSAIVANPEVEGVYADYIRDVVATSSFEFKERILKVALDSFGTINFGTWCIAQYDSKAAGDLHNRFIEDTLRFIVEGRREMSLMTWMSLIKITDEGNNIGHMSQQTKDYLKTLSDYRAETYNINLLEVIQKWCSKPGGMEDMLVTLHILFGSV